MASEKPALEVEVDLDPTFAWRLEQLERAGFHHFAAFRIAMTGCDYRKAVHMLELGASQDLIVNEFTD